METYEGGPVDDSLESLYNKYAERSPDAGGEGYRQPFLDRVIEGTKKGFGTDRLGLSPENQIKYDPTGIFQTFAAPADLAFRAPGAITGFLSSLLAGGYGKIPGVNETQTNSANRDLYNLGNAAMLELGNPRARAPTDISSIPRYGEVLPPVPSAPLTAIKRAEPPVIDMYGETQPRPPVPPAFDLPASQSRPLSLEYTAPVVEPTAAPVRRAKEVPVAAPVPTYDRQLSPLGFYSYGAETAANLAQAKGTPQQFRSMLEKGGVKPVEMEGFNEAFANRPIVTRDELTQYFNERRPQVEETVLGGRGKPEMDDAAKQKWIEDSAAERAYNSGDLDEIGDWRGASDEIRNWHLYEARYEFNEEMAFNPDFASRFQTIGKDGDTKFQQYTLPGGENYREVLLKLPERVDEAEAVYAQIRPMFRSQHWDDPNVLAHLRMSDRTGSNGEKILHLEEIQSDWGQKGKKEGFLNPNDNMADLAKEYDYLTKQRQALEVSIRNGDDATPNTQAAVSRLGEIHNSMYALSNRMAAVRSDQPPTAPYVTTTAAWTDLALKRALKEAAEGGYDRLVWTPGAEQAKRYDLSKHVSEVRYDPNEKTLFAYNENGTEVMNKSGVEPNKIADYIGKEPAEKLLLEVDNRSAVWDQYEIARDPKTNKWAIYLANTDVPAVRLPEWEGNGVVTFKSKSEARNHLRSMVDEEITSNLPSISGQDLVMGGEGMKAYYDKIIPNQLSKLLKKIDPSAKVGITDVMLPRGENSMMGHNNPPFEAPGVTITPKMREAIMKGQTDFARGGSVKGYATGGPANNSLEALYNKYAAPTMRQRTRARFANGGPVSSAAIYDPAEIDALAASIIEGNYA